MAAVGQPLDPGQPVLPGPADPRNRELVDGVERVVPVDTLLDARVPHHQHGEDGEERHPGGEHGSGKRLAREKGVRETGSAGNERGQPPSGEVLRQAAFHGSVPGVRRGPLFVVRDHPRAFRAPMLSRQ